MRAVRYLRVSTPFQAEEERFGLRVQTEVAERNEERHGLEVVKVYTDTISGASETRRGLEELKREAPALGAVAVSLSYTDRLSRDMRGGYALLGELVDTGLRIYAADVGAGMIDLDDDSSLIDTNLRLLMATLERRRIRERTYGGLLAKARSGVPVRRLNAYGFHQGEIDEAEARWVRWMYEQALTTGATSIAAALNERGVRPPGRALRWSKGSVASLLKKPLYRGSYEFGRLLTCKCGRKRKGNVHDANRGFRICECGGRMELNRIVTEVPAIVEPGRWEAVQRAIAQRRQNAGRTGERKEIFALQGRIRCAVCGGAMSAQQMSRYWAREWSGKGRPGPVEQAERWRVWLREYLSNGYNAAAAARVMGSASPRGAGWRAKRRWLHLIEAHRAGELTLEEAVASIPTPTRSSLRYYHCRRATEKVAASGASRRCTHRKFYPIEPLHEAVLGELRRIFSDERALRAALELDAPPEPDFGPVRARLLRELERAKAAYLEGVFELGEYSAERKRLEAALSALPPPTLSRAPVDLPGYRERVLAALDELPLHEVVREARLTVRVAPGGEVGLEFEG